MSGLSKTRDGVILSFLVSHPVIGNQDFLNAIHESNRQDTQEIFRQL